MNKPTIRRPVETFERETEAVVGAPSEKTEAPDKMKASEIIQGISWIFNGVEVIDNFLNDVSDAKMETYVDGFRDFQGLTDNADNPDEQRFLSSPRIFALSLGLNSELQMSTGDGMIFFKNAKKLGIDDKFLSLQYEDDFDGDGNKFPMLMVYNRQGAEAALRDHAEQLKLEFPEEPLSAEQLSTMIQELYNSDDKERANRARGVISGFPDDAIDWYIENSKRNPSGLPDTPVHNMTDHVKDYVNSGGDGSLPYAPDKEAHSQMFTPYDAPSPDDRNSLTISAMGVNFNAPKPMTEGVREHCRTMMEVSRRLRLPDYLQVLNDKTGVKRI